MAESLGRQAAAAAAAVLAALLLGGVSAAWAADKKAAREKPPQTKLECRMNTVTKIPGDTTEYNIKRVNCENVDEIEDELDRSLTQSNCESFVVDPANMEFTISQDQRRYEYYRESAKNETTKTIDRTTGEYRKKFEVKAEFRRPNRYAVIEVRGTCAPFSPQF